MRHRIGEHHLKNPRILLLIDAIGAFLTFLFTACLLAPSWIPTGLPTTTVAALAVAALGLFLTSLSGFCALTGLRQRLRLVAVLNSLYCIVTVGLCVYYCMTLTIWGAIYFAIEVPVVLVLASIEWRTANWAAAKHEVGQ